MLPVLYNNNYEIIQTPDTVMILVEMVHDVRVIHMNAQHGPEEIHKWLGDSIGHWEGDTLVVETTNVNPLNRFRGASENVKVIERFQRYDARHDSVSRDDRRSDRVHQAVDPRISVPRDARSGL